MRGEAIGSDPMVFGFESINEYQQGPKCTDIVSLTYNTLLHKYIIVDGRGIFSWSHRTSSPRSTCELSFPKYHNRMLRCLIFCEKHNVYFAICHDYTLQVYNKNFEPTCKVENQNMRAIQHVVFNSQQNELITTGIAGTTIWKYQQMTKATFHEIKPMANYSAHGSALTSIAYWLKGKMLVTGGMDAEVKVWSSLGGHICTFRGHSRPVTSIVVHPHLNGFVMSASLDGTVKVWSLSMLELIYSYSVFADGIDWMSVTPDGYVWCATVRQLLVYKFNSFAEFWGHTQCKVTRLQAVEDIQKSNRIIVVGDDGSIRLFRESVPETDVLCTVLPPPTVSLTESVMVVSYSRFNNIFFVLLNPWKIWVYTGKTDPACRLAEWDVAKIQKSSPGTEEDSKAAKKEVMLPQLQKHVMNRPSAKDGGHGVISNCSSLECVYSSQGFQFHEENGICSARPRHLLAIGLKDGRILFMDQKQRGLKYFEMQVSNGPVVDISFDFCNQRLVTRCANMDSVIQIWGLPGIDQLFRFTLESSFTAYALFGNIFVSGYDNGSVVLKNLSESQPMIDLENISGFGKLESDGLSDDHKAPIIDIKSCEPQKIFCSCSSDGVMKIWNYSKILLNEIVLDESLSSCTFINSFGDLLIGWKRHVFVIFHHHVSPYHQSCMSVDSLEFHDCESEIYEDPAIKYDSHFEEQEDSPLTMQKYLIPFSFINVEDPHQFTSIENQPAKQEDSETSSSEQSLHAPSETYISPASSYDCLSFLTSYPEIKKFQPLYDSEGINFPYFGTSPGPTPTESSESEIEIENKDHVEDVYDPVIWKSEVALDAAQQVTLASNVYKAVNLMKPQVPGLEIVEGPVEDERPSSRFANARIDARAMMKAAVSAVIAVNKFSKSAPTTPRKTRIRAKKKRKESVNSLTAQRRRSVTVDDVDEESSYQVSTATSPAVTTVGFAGKEVPFGKSVSIPSKQGQVKGQRAVVTATKSARLTKAKNQGDSLKTRKKAQGSKSASSFQQDSVKQIKKKTRSSSQAGPRLQSVPEFVKKPLHETSAGSGSGIGVAGGGGGITQVQMTYKRPELFKNEEKSKQVEVDETSKETSLDQKKSEESPQKPACNADPGADLKSTKDFLQRFLQSPRPNTTMSGRGDKIAEKDKRPITRGRTKSGDHVKSYHDDEDDDPDRSKLADVLDYDLHAIYKKDGLRFDECWQERMLERYQLMKLQREQRHYAAASKRTMLEHDRKYKILSHKPELMYHDTFAWYEDHARFAEHVMNSPLFAGDADRVETTDGFVAKQLDGPVSAISTNRSNLAPPAARPPSIAETLLRSASRQDLATPQSEKPDLTKKYRFSFRRTSDGDQSSTIDSPARPSTAESRGIVTPMPSPVPAATPISVANLRQASSAKSMRKFLVERPRSSTSIPGKTRYVLIKSDPPHFTKTTRTPSPTKLEEDLLKQRFPSQHHQLMRSLGRLESSQDKWYSDAKSSDDDDQQSRSARYSAVSPRRSGTFETTPRSLVAGDSTNGRSWRRPSIRESAPAVLQARDPSLISVLHRKSSNYVPAAFKV